MWFVGITAPSASQFLSLVFHTDLRQPAISTCPLSSLIRINSCELYHEILEKNVRDYAGEWGTNVTVLGRSGGLFHGTHFPSLSMASCSTQVTTVHKVITYSDCFVKFFETRATNEVINVLGVMPFRHLQGLLVKLLALFIATQDATE